MSEKFRRIVNTPHMAFVNATKKIMEKNPKNAAGKTAQVFGGTVTGLSAAALWLIKTLTVDNKLLQWGEEKFANIDQPKNKLAGFAKKYPGLSSHLIYYMIISLFIGGVKTGVDLDNALEQYKEYKELKDAKKNTYAAYKDRLKDITPYLIANLICMEGVNINEQGLHTPYLCSKGVPTIGFGSTMLKDGTPVTMDTPPITTEEAYELARWHLEEGETYWGMYCYDVANEKMDINTTQKAVAMGSVMYNGFSNLIEKKGSWNCNERFAQLRKDWTAYGLALPDSVVQKEFAKYPMNDKDLLSFGRALIDGENNEVLGDKLGNFLADGPGLRWRRWLESCLLNGDITPEDLLECPASGMPEFFMLVGQDRENWFIKDKNGNRTTNRETVKKFKNWLENPVNKHGKSMADKKTAKDFLPDDVRQKCLSGKCQLAMEDDKNIFDFWNVEKEEQKHKEVEVKTYIIGYDEMYADALGSYKKQDFKQAAQKYENMIKKYPDNALLRDDLAATYNRLGRYDDAIKQVKEIVARIGDRSQYGAAQYNAGVAYEALGNWERALKNYKVAFANGNKNAKPGIDRVTNQMKFYKNQTNAGGRN